MPPAVLTSIRFELRQDRDQHRENAGGSADDIGNRLGEECAVGSHAACAAREKMESAVQR